MEIPRRWYTQYCPWKLRTYASEARIVWIWFNFPCVSLHRCLRIKHCNGARNASSGSGNVLPSPQCYISRCWMQKWHIRKASDYSTLHFTHVWCQEPCRRKAGRWGAAWQRARETGFDQHWSLIFPSSLTPSSLLPFLPTILPLSSINKVNSWREMWGPAQNWRIEATNNGKNSTNILILLWDIISNKWWIQPETLKDG